MQQTVKPVSIEHSGGFSPVDQNLSQCIHCLILICFCFTGTISLLGLPMPMKQGIKWSGSLRSKVIFEMKRRAFFLHSNGFFP